MRDYGPRKDPWSAPGGTLNRGTRVFNKEDELLRIHVKMGCLFARLLYVINISDTYTAKNNVRLLVNISVYQKLKHSSICKNQKKGLTLGSVVENTVVWFRTSVPPRLVDWDRCKVPPKNFENRFQVVWSEELEKILGTFVQKVIRPTHGF